MNEFNDINKTEEVAIHGPKKLTATEVDALRQGFFTQSEAQVGDESEVAA